MGPQRHLRGDVDFAIAVVQNNPEALLQGIAGWESHELNDRFLSIVEGHKGEIFHCKV